MSRGGVTSGVGEQSVVGSREEGKWREIEPSISSSRSSFLSSSAFLLAESFEISGSEGDEWYAFGNKWKNNDVEKLATSPFSSFISVVVSLSTLRK